MSWLSAPGMVSIQGENRLAASANYFIGADPSRWRTGAPTYGQVRYAGVQPGIDLAFYGTGRKLEYDVVLAPGANVSRFKLQFDEGNRVAIGHDGELIINAGAAQVKQNAPLVYQLQDGKKIPIRARYVLCARNSVGFALDGADPALPTVIDPVIVYSYAFGSFGLDAGNAIAVDPSGNCYIGGVAKMGFPTAGPPYKNSAANLTGVVMKFSPTGALVYSTYIGGSYGYGAVNGIAVDGSGNAYITGSERYDDFPVTAGAYHSAAAGATKVFVAKLNATGSALITSAVVGGSALEAGYAIAIDASGAAYVAGETTSTDFPTTPGAYRRTGGPAFAFKLSPDATTLAYSTYLDAGSAFAVTADSAGYAYIGGSTGYLLKLNPAGSAVVYSKLLASGGDQAVYGVVLDSDNGVWVTGYTSYSASLAGFPVTSGAYQSSFNGSFKNAFLTKINAAGTIAYSTLFGQGSDIGRGVALDGSGNPIIVGSTGSTSTFPLVSPVDAVYSAGFAAKFDGQAHSLLFATFLGMDDARAVAADASGNIFATGYGYSMVQTASAPVQSSGQGVAVVRINTSSTCTISLSKSQIDLTAAASTASVDVATGAGCNWIAVNGASWVTIQPGQAGSGAGTVTLNAAANTGAARSAKVSVGGRVVTVTQPANCTYSMDSYSASFPAVGGGGYLTVTSPQGCPVSQASNASWITIPAYQGSPNDTYTLSYGVAANFGAPRTGTFTVSGMTFTITQAGNLTCTYQLTASTYQFLSANAGMDSVAVNTQTPCPWTAQPQVDWLSLLQDYTSRTGPGPVVFSATANATGNTRTGTILIAGQTLTVTQPGGNQTPTVGNIIDAGMQGSWRVLSAGVADNDGATDIAKLDIIISPSGATANACYIEYSPIGRTIQVSNDAGTAFGTAAVLGTSTTVGNSQCTVDVSRVNDALTGPGLSITLYVSFASGFGGAEMVKSQVWDRAGATSGLQTVGDFTISSALGFYPLSPCRVADTRTDQGKTGVYGPPALPPYFTRQFPIVGNPCSASPAAQAFSLNITVHPAAGLDWLSSFAAGQPYPGVSTLNAPGGGYLANAAIVPAGLNGGISVVGGQTTDLIIDVNGYFAPPQLGELTFYPMTPCRAADTRSDQGKTGAFGPPFLAGYSSRDFPIRSSACQIPAAARAYALNITALPHGPLSFLSMWPQGESYPGASTLNSTNGDIIANSAIIPSGTNGGVTVVAGDPTDLIIDINGYFAPPGAGGLHFYTVRPCRLVDTRSDQGKTGAFGPPRLEAYSQRDFPVASYCGVPATAQAFSLNMTVIPPGPVDFLSMWPAGGYYPGASTLNSPGGRMIANAAFIQAGTNGAITVVTGKPTDLVIDVNGYFAP
ncbi:MAG: SBBP repeat-containing protein [Acidobacteria bacterium]|nr:SBBP repeat-containing protein [Acidobacteriota bacterium]